MRESRLNWILIPVLLATAIAASPLAAQDAGVGDRAPVITIAALDGAATRLDARGANRPMVIEFWATWCDVCDALLPTVRKAHATYGDRVDFYGVNVTVNESKRRVERWVEQERPPYRTLYDETGTAVRAFKAPVTSYVVIVDSAGVIRYTGSGSDQDLVKILATVVK
jgi:thiol-disulfide isomerase/thioredoxin